MQALRGRFGGRDVEAVVALRARQPSPPPRAAKRQPRQRRRREHASAGRNRCSSIAGGATETSGGELPCLAAALELTVSLENNRVERRGAGLLGTCRNGASAASRHARHLAGILLSARQVPLAEPAGGHLSARADEPEETRITKVENPVGLRENVRQAAP